MQWSIGSTSCERWRAQPGAAVGVDRVLHAGAPGRAPRPRAACRPGPASTVPSQPASSGVSPASRCSCSAITSPLSRRWAPGLACCQSQPPHRPGPANGQGASTRSLDALEDPHGVGAQEARALLALGDPGDDPLAGQRVPDEQHLALVGPGDAVAAVRDGADLDLVLLARPATSRAVGLHGGVTPEVG